MAKAKTTDTKGQTIEIPPLVTGRVTVWIKGDSPLIFNCMSSKARHELLFPNGPPSKKDKESRLKHDPLVEYRQSVYRQPGDDVPTRLVFPATAFKATMMNAALEIPGAKKTQIGRLVWVNGYNVPIWGVPQLLISVVRSAGMDRTPDMRTRAILPEWATCVDVSFTKPSINETTVAHLLAAAGVVIGVGDYRQEKGKGSFGQFSICEEKDLKQHFKTGGRKAQDEALKYPAFYDNESQELFEWFEEELKVRGKSEMSRRELVPG